MMTSRQAKLGLKIQARTILQGVAVSSVALLLGCGASSGLPPEELGQTNPLAADLRSHSPVPAAGDHDSGVTGRVAADSDRDGIADEIEIAIGTDPLSIDSDHDGLTDHYELWGEEGIPLGKTGDLTQLNDPNDNGIIAPLDIGDMAGTVLKNASELIYRERVPVTLPEEGPMLPNDVDGDGIPNDFELFGFYFEVAEDNQPYFVRWPWWQDLYDLDIPYYKTDPTQWSSDGDPFSDWEEATKINLDPRVKSPADHPCIPAYPRLEAFLTSYSIELKQDVEIKSASGGKTDQSWSSGSTSIIESKTSFESHGFELDSKVGGLFEVTTGTEIKGAGPAIIATPVPECTMLFHGELDAMYLGAASTASVSGGLAGGAATAFVSKSGIRAKEWSTATATAFNTSEVAALILNMKIVNTGTLPATNARVLFNLYLGDVAINSFVVPLEEYGEILPMAENPVDVVVTDDGRGAPLVLSMDQLRSIESGVPLKIESTGFVADTLVWDIDPDTGRRTFLTMGPWAPYESAIQNCTAKLIVDFSNDPTFAPSFGGALPPRGVSEVRVFCHSPYNDYAGSPPFITLADGLVWAFGAKNSSIGPILTIRDPISRVKHSAAITGWKFAFDKLTLEKMAADPSYMEGIFGLPLEPSNPGERVYVLRAPPQGENAKPRIYWAACDPPSRKVRAFSYDLQGVSEMRFKPDPDADYDGEVMLIGYDPADPAQEFAYTYELPAQYKWTGFEQVVAINRIGKRTVMNIDVIGAELGSQTDGDTFGVTWSDPGMPYRQGFNFNGGTITNPLFDLTFRQQYAVGFDLKLTLEPENGGGLHDALYVIDPDPYGDPPAYLLDYNYLRKQIYDTSTVLTETIPASGSSEPPLCKTYAVKSQTGVLAVFKPELTSVDVGGGQWSYYVSSIIWRTYEGI